MAPYIYSAPEILGPEPVSAAERPDSSIQTVGEADSDGNKGFFALSHDPFPSGRTFSHSFLCLFQVLKQSLTAHPPLASHPSSPERTGNCQLGKGVDVNAQDFADLS